LSDKKSKSEKKEWKKKKITISKIMTPIVMVLFVLLLLILLNVQPLCHMLNRHSYEKVQATVVEKTADPFTMLVPMVDVKYEYQGTAYEEKKYFVLAPFFGLKAEAGTPITIYVNKGAPNHFLLKENFFANWINWLLIIFEAVFISLLVRRIRQAGRNRKEKKSKRKRR
jgi:amino acid transporter